LLNHLEGGLEHVPFNVAQCRDCHIRSAKQEREVLLSAQAGADHSDTQAAFGSGGGRETMRKISGSCGGLKEIATTH
jgi:hypothetical protein